MMTIVALFLSLVSLFYYYCKTDTTPAESLQSDQQYIEVPSEMSPIFNYEEMPGNTTREDSMANFISARQNYYRNTSAFLQQAVSDF